MTGGTSTLRARSPLRVRTTSSPTSSVPTPTSRRFTRCARRSATCGATPSGASCARGLPGGAAGRRAGPRCGRLEVLLPPGQLVEHAVDVVPVARDAVRLVGVADHLRRHAAPLQREVHLLALFV